MFRNGTSEVNNITSIYHDMEESNSETTSFINSGDAIDHSDTPHSSVSTNLAILPVLAVLIFLTYVCLKCCHWFRESLKDRDEGDVENSGFVILTEGDDEYKDVEFRSDTHSCYDTISSYTSFIKSNNHYDTVTSVRSLQVPRPHDTYNSYNSYREFLMHRLDGSKYNTVNSVRSFLSNAAELKDAEVQVELVNMASERPNSLAPQDRRHYSIDAIPPRAEPSQLESCTDIQRIQHRSLKHHNRHHVSFADRSTSVDASNKPLIDTDVHKYNATKTYSLKHLWGIRDQSRQHHVNKSSSPSVVHQDKMATSEKLDTHQTADSMQSPISNTNVILRPHRFRVCKADESLLMSKSNENNVQRITNQNSGDILTSYKPENHSNKSEALFLQSVSGNNNVDVTTITNENNATKELENIVTVANVSPKEQSSTTQAYLTLELEGDLSDDTDSGVCNELNHCNYDTDSNI